MKYLLVLLTLFTFNVAFGQRTMHDSLAGNMYLDKYVNRYVDSLESNEDIKTLETKYGMGFNSLSACINPLTTQLLTADEVKIIYNRLGQLAEIFFQEGNPILISVGGSNSVEVCDRLNKKRNKYNLSYVSFGNGCMVNQREKDFENVFNERTMKLLGVKKIN